MPNSADMLRYKRPQWLKTMFIVIACAAVLIVAAGLVIRLTSSHGLAVETQAAVEPAVTVISPSNGEGSRVLVLPGNIRAFYEAPIYAQVSGYLNRWYTDIGTQVQAGQLLADIDTPDLDQQLAQARAGLATAVANQHLAATTAQRWNALLAKDAVAQQDADEKNADFAAQTAAMDAARANVDRLLAQEAFKRITAPFAGVVTSRSTDVGALISVGSPNQTPLFTVDDEHRLRIYVAVPQVYSAEIKPGMKATFIVPEYPGQSFTATLASTASAINTGSGTLLVQFQTDNPKNLLQPGDYAQVHIALPPNPKAFMLPSSALMFRDGGMQVATIGADGRVVMKPVTIGRDFGATVEIAYGVNHADRVINNPPDALEQGDAVNVVNALR